MIRFFYYIRSIHIMALSSLLFFIAHIRAFEDTSVGTKKVAIPKTGGKLINTLSLFKGDTLVAIAPSWMLMGNFSLPKTARLQSNQSSNRHWRLKVSYRVDKPSQKFNLMARINSGNLVKGTTFFVSSDDGRIGYRQAYSNWINPNSADLNSLSSYPLSFTLFPSSSSKEELNFISALSLSGSQKSTTESTLSSAHVYIELVELEIWNSGSLLDNTRIASIAKQPEERVIIDKNVSIITQKQNPERMTPVVSAMETGISFLRVSSTDGFLPAKEYLSQQIVSLSNLEIINTNNIPIFKLSAGFTFQDYLANYEPQVFSYSQFAGLFDGLESRKIADWELSPKSYLFIGNNVKPWGRDMFPGQPLVFILEEDDGVMKIKAFP